MVMVDATSHVMIATPLNLRCSLEAKMKGAALVLQERLSSQQSV